MPSPYIQPIVKPKELSETEKENIKEATEELIKASVPVAKPVIKKIAGSLVRHGLTLLAGCLLSKGIIDSSGSQDLMGVSGQVTDLVVAGAMYGLSQYLSIREKTKKEE